MTYLPRIALLGLLLASSAGACAVTVTEGSGGAGGTGNASSTTGQSVTATATGTGGVPSTTTTGGFGSSSITGSSTGSFTTAVSSTATGTGGSTSVSSSSSSTGGAYEPCLNYNDLTIIHNTEVFATLVACGMMYIGSEPQNLDCLVSKTGLSEACASCYDSETHCIIQSCVGMCASDPMGAGCTSCRAQKCDPTFMACSGLNHGP